MNVSDIISIIAIIISLFSATYCANIVAQSRTQRDFIMEEIKLLKNEYKDLVLSMRRGELKADFIRDALRSFSSRIQAIVTLASGEYTIRKSNELVSSHEDFQWEITQLDSINSQFSNDVDIFSPDEISKIIKSHIKIDESFLKLIVEVNRAPKVLPWDREEENLGF